MQIRKATIQDEQRWNTFVETEGGSFFHYFEWKTIYEGNKWLYIPLLLENETNDIVGIFPLVKIKFFFYSKLVSLPDGASGGYIFKKSLTESEKQQAFQIFVSYINQQYSKGCSTFILKENLFVDDASRSQPTELLVKNGFRFRFDVEIKLPCTYRLPLAPSFEDDIWEELWGKYLRNHIRKSQKQGVVVTEDTNGQYHEDVITMILSIYKKFDEKPPLKEEMRLRLTAFKEKTKIWVALLNNTPIAALVCYNFTGSLCYASKMGYKPAAREYFTTVLLFSEAIKDACENGYQFFEFGVTETMKLAQWKEQFKPIKIPMRIYEKKYSTIRTFVEKTPSLLKWTLKNVPYIWYHRRRILRKIMRGEI